MVVIQLAIFLEGIHMIKTFNLGPIVAYIEPKSKLKRPNEFE